MSRAVVVRIEGPFTERDDWGDKRIYWTVVAEDEEGDPCSTEYEVHSLTRARALAEEMAMDRDCDVIDGTEG